MDKSKKITISLYVLSIFLILGISYAYFSLNIIGNDSAKLSVISSGTLELTFTDKSNEITLNNAVPGDSFQKEISVKNTGTLDAMYNIIWQELTNEFVRNEIVISATCERLNSEGVVDGTCNNIEEKPVGRLSIPQKISIEAGITHKYTVTVKFIDTGKNQNYNQGKTFDGKLGIEEYKDNTPEATYCTFDGELTEGAEYVNGQYTYRYKQTYYSSSIGDPWADSSKATFEWVSLEETLGDTSDGWGIALTDKDSTDPVTTTPCTYINNKPVISAMMTYANSKATSIDLSKFNTSNIKYMYYTFTNSEASVLDLSSFDTHNVTFMVGMFQGTKATTIDVSNFDTSNVTNMLFMFVNSNATSLDLSSFDTSKVTNMGGMFEVCKATTINVSSFDTSNVTLIAEMFAGSEVTSLNLTNFDVSNVESLQLMFKATKLSSLDLSSFDTSNVTDMYEMFSDSTNLKTIYVSLDFDVSKVEPCQKIFNGCTSLVGGAGTTYNSNKIYKGYAHIDGGPNKPGYFTSKNKVSYDSIIVSTDTCVQ